MGKQTNGVGGQPGQVALLERLGAQLHHERVYERVLNVAHDAERAVHFGQLLDHEDGGHERAARATIPTRYLDAHQLHLNLHI